MGFETDRAVLVFRFEHLKGFGKAGSANELQTARTDFWDPFQVESNEINRERFIRGKESVLREKFGSELAELLWMRFGGHRTYQSTLQRMFSAPTRLVSFRVIGIGYGSLEISTLVEGFKGVADAFDNNFEVFRLALEGLAPEAFAAATGTAVAVSCDVAKSSPGVDAATEKSTRLRWLWILSNTSLILPVALSLLVLYVGATFGLQLLSKEADMLEARAKDLRDRQAALIAAYGEHDKHLSGQVVEAIRAIAKASSAPPVCCCRSVPSTPPAARARANQVCH